MTEQEIKAHQEKQDTMVKRLEWLLDLLPGGSVAYENGYAIPQEIEKYLAIEYSDSEPVWAFGAETLAKLAEEMDKSETSSTHTDVWDLDAKQMLRPITRTVGFFGHDDSLGVTRTDVFTVEPVFVPTEVDLAYIAAARQDDRIDDECEIDDSPMTSRPDADEGGCWVAAWLWIRAAEAGICRICGQPGANGDDSYDGMCPSCADKTECQEDGCGAQVEADDPYFATPCGTFCPEHMREHAKGCGVCAKEFDLRS